ncbi:MAG: purine-nucleoside phosphorylase [Spirochaetales bacterium]|nr:purine-nucleoside phosphorylase [Spirochaetales bacterium]
MRKTRNLCVSAAAVMLIMLALVLCGCRSTASAETLSPYERIDACRRQIEKITDFRPQVVIVLGSGLGDYVKSLDVKAVIPYSDIDGWPESTAPLHAGNLVFAEYKGLRLAVMQGRLHFYEGYTMEEVVLPLRVLHLLGAETAILSNAVGSMNPDFKVGEFVCVNDQITSFVRSPLIGQNISQLGDRFFSMTDVFDKDMQETVLRVGRENCIPVHSGVYVQVTGPQFETPAEIRMYRLCGADTVAMSLGAEVIAAAHMGMKVCAINCISNMASGMEEFTSHSINETMKGVVPDFTVLVNGLLDTLAAN